jgi:hypothetical protein
VGRTDVLARGPVELRIPDARSGTVRLLALAVVATLVACFAVWLISPRFEIDTPSLVDDWASLSRSGDQIAELARLDNPEDQRFVPSVAVWSYVQWHTFDAPGGLVGPNAWNLLRLLTLVVGLTLLMAVALRTPRGGWDAVLLAALAGIPAFAVVTVPKFARDLARFGPQEPMLVGALSLGGALVVLAARLLLTTSRSVGSWGTAALAVGGSGFWIFGAYHKETSVCAIPLIAAALFAGRNRLASWPLLSTGRRIALGLLATVVALPLLHVTVEGARLAARGDLIYGAEVEGGGDLWTGFRKLYDWAHEPLPENARLLMYSALALTAVVSVIRRRIDPVPVGALVSGLLSLAFAGQSGVLATRYYIPIYALFAVAFALSLARLPTPVQLAGVLCVFLAFIPPPDTRKEVARWTDEEVAGAAVVREAAALERSGCTIAIDGVDPETTEALPVLVGLERDGPAKPCGDSPAYLLLGPGGETTSLFAACGRGSLVAITESPLVTLHRCGQLARSPVRDPSLGLVSPKRLIALRRLDSAAS